MHPVLLAELELQGGLIVIAALPETLPRWAVDNALRTGELVRVWPGVYRSASRDVDPRAAALTYAGAAAALSHTSALVIWGLLPVEPDQQVHVTISRERRLRSASGLVLHTRLGFTADPPQVVARSGLRVTALADSLVAAWPMVPEPQRVGMLVDAVSERMTLPLRIAEAVGRVPKLTHRTALIKVVDRLAAGCRSHLELFGADHVFVGRDLPEFQRQAPVTVDGRTYYLDLYAERERVNVELDGASWHGSAQQRERDLRRDAALATRGILVVRYTYQRLVRDPAEVRRELRRILTQRG